jgi:hypothetical protein
MRGTLIEIRLTRQGRDVFKRADARIAALAGSLAADLSPADLTALKEMLAPSHRRSVPGSGRRSRTVAHNSGLRQPGRPRANHWHMRRGGQAPATPGLEQPAPQPWRRQTGADRQAPRRPREQDHPIPPEHVKLLRARNRRYGTTPDGGSSRLPGRHHPDSAYSAVWAEARKQALTPAQVDPASGGACAQLCDAVQRMRTGRRRGRLLPERVAGEGRELVNVMAAP